MNTPVLFFRCVTVFVIPMRRPMRLQDLANEQESAVAPSPTVTLTPAPIWRALRHNAEIARRHGQTRDGAPTENVGVVNATSTHVDNIFDLLHFCLGMNDQTTGMLKNLVAASRTAGGVQKHDTTTDDLDKTEPHRLRSLRAIIYDAGQRRAVRKAEGSDVAEVIPTTKRTASPRRTRSQSGSLMNVLLDELLAKRKLPCSYILDPERTANVLSDVANPDLIFAKLAPITPSLSSSNADTWTVIQEITLWLESFKDRLREKLGEGQDKALDAYIQLLMHVHPELTSIVQNRSPDPHPQRVMKRKTPARTRAQNPTLVLSHSWLDRS